MSVGLLSRMMLRTFVPERRALPGLQAVVEHSVLERTSVEY